MAEGASVVSFFVCSDEKCRLSWRHGHFAIPLGPGMREIWSKALFSRVSASEYLRDHFPREDHERLQGEVMATELPLMLEDDIGDPDEDE